MKMSPVRFVSIIKGWCMKQFPKTEEGAQRRDEWLASLDQPLPGETIVVEPSREDLEADAAMFLAAMKG